MQFLRFGSEVVTPLFLAGANQEDAYELRAPSFKGLMRWWFRSAFVGPIAELKKREAALFGNTDKASVFNIRVSQPSLRSNIFQKSDYDAGIQYMGFSLDAAKKQRTFIEVGEQFNISLSFYPSALENDRKAILSSLWLLFHFGAVGARSRRGFGSLKVNSAPKNILPKGLEFLIKANGIRQLKDLLERNLATARAWINPNGYNNSSSEFSVLAPDKSDIYLWNDLFSDWVDALNEAGTLLMEWRRRRGPDYNDVKGFLRTGKAPTTVQRAAFGLPIQFYYSSLERLHLKELAKQRLIEANREQPADAEKYTRPLAEKMNKQARKRLLSSFHWDDRDIENLFRKARQLATAYIGGKSQEDNRRASPLLVKVIRVDNNQNIQYALIFLFMKAPLLGKVNNANERIRIEAEDKPVVLVEQPSFAAIEKFIEEKIRPNSKRLNYQATP